MIRTLSLLMIGTMSLWLLLAWPTYYFLGGSVAMALSGAAAVLCLVPTTLTLAWALWAFRAQPEQQFLAVMGGTGVALGFRHCHGSGPVFPGSGLPEPGFLVVGGGLLPVYSGIGDGFVDPAYGKSTASQELTTGGVSSWIAVFLVHARDCTADP